MSSSNRSEIISTGILITELSKDQTNPIMRGRGGLPRIAILSSALEAVESIGIWFQRAGYPLSLSHYNSVDTHTITLEPADIILLYTLSPDSDLPFVAEMLQKQYERRKPGIILLTTREAVGQVDFTAGFDDFVTIPLDPQEIEVRIKFAIWRRHGVQVNDMIICGDLAIDVGNYEVTVQGESVDLTLKEYELLKYMAMRRGRAFTRDHLLAQVWGYDYFGGTRTVDVHVRRLRMKIERYGIKFIQTVRGVGYKFGE